MEDVARENLFGKRDPVYSPRYECFETVRVLDELISFVNPALGTCDDLS
jgi:hypothetical protein